MKEVRIRSKRRPLAIFAAAMAMGACVDTSKPTPDASPASTYTPKPGDAVTMTAAMGFGANIGNTLENTVTWETGWGQPRITQAFIQGMAANGIKNIRLPVAWDTYSEAGVVPADKMARVREVVQWVLDAGMYCVVNIHWDNGWIRSDKVPDRQYTLTDEVRARFTSYWQQIATAFADVDDRLLFEALNEEGEFYVNGNKGLGPDYAPLNELNQLFVTTVRAIGGYNATRNLVIAGFGTDIAKTCVDAFAIPSDPAGFGKLFLSVHYYTPYPFCIMSEPAILWGSTVTNPATTWGTPSEVAELAKNFAIVAGFSKARGIPAYLGEYQVDKGRGQFKREPASRQLWLLSVTRTAMENGIVPVLWDTATDISRDDGSLSTDLSAVMTGLGLDTGAAANER